MVTKTCTHCGGSVQAEADRPLALCPYCAKPFAKAESAAPSALQKQLKALKTPKQKYALIMEALAREPNDFDANEALLYHGRLHEPMTGRGIDYAIIKCHLISVLDHPEIYNEAKLKEKYDELLRGPQLLKTMALAADPEGFFIAYLRRLTFEYIDLFIRGDSQYSRTAFGFFKSNSAIAKNCLAPVRRMLRNVSKTPYLDEAQRLLIRDAIMDGYRAAFPGDAELLLEDTFMHENTDGRT